MAAPTEGELLRASVSVVDDRELTLKKVRVDLFASVRGSTRLVHTAGMVGLMPEKAEEAADEARAALERLAIPLSE